MRILLVTRETKKRTALKQVLEQDPEITVVGVVTTPRELLARAQTAEPDLVLLDWSLPGRRASKMLSALQTLPRAPRVVAFTEHREPAQHALVAKVNAFVSQEDPFEWLLSVLYSVSGLSPCRGF